jgi:hypothetical protein
MTVTTIWRELEAARAPDASGYVRRLVRPDLPIELSLAIARPSMKRCLLMSAEPGSGAHASFSGARGITSQVVSVAPDIHWLELSLTDPGSADMFDALLEDLIAAIPAGAPRREAMSALLARLARWQRFLRASAAPLGKEAQHGLYGELWFLLHHLAPSHGPLAVAGWTGPDRELQDFQLGDVAVEVKTCVGQQAQAMRISSERQLDVPPGVRLYLFHISVDVRRGSKDTLVALVDQVRATFRGSSGADALEDRLAASGYSDVDARHYAQTDYAVREHNLFRVRDGFPRITERDIPDGVGEVAYSLAVAVCRPFAASMSELGPRRA